MSHTNNTPNLQLAQFVADDKPTWLGDWNSTMLTIDNAVGTAQETLSTVSGKVDTVEEDIASLSEELNTIKPSNVGAVDQVLTKKADTQEWTSLDASNVAYNNSELQSTNVKGAIDEVVTKLDQVGDITSNQSDATTVSNSASMTLASITLPAGSYVITACAQFGSNNAGYRSLSISTTNNTHAVWSQGRVTVLPISGNMMVNSERIVSHNTSTTYYCVVSHTGSSSLTCYGNIRAIKIG